MIFPHEEALHHKGEIHSFHPKLLSYKHYQPYVIRVLAYVMPLIFDPYSDVTGNLKQRQTPSSPFMAMTEIRGSKRMLPPNFVSV